MTGSEVFSAYLGPYQISEASCKNSKRLKVVNYFPEKLHNRWNKVFKNGPSKICGRQPLKSLKGYGLHSRWQVAYILSLGN